jgi:hypothetical protein
MQKGQIKVKKMCVMNNFRTDKYSKYLNYLPRYLRLTLLGVPSLF